MLSTVITMTTLRFPLRISMVLYLIKIHPLTV
nr:MAG TPA: hypothetical protein [Caudoviricetes sp.]